MKITIDTTAKTIYVEQFVNVAQLIEELSAMVPNWKEYAFIPKPIDLSGWPYTYTGTTTQPINIPAAPPYKPGDTYPAPFPNPIIFGPLYPHTGLPPWGNPNDVILKSGEVYDWPNGASNTTKTN